MGAAESRLCAQVPTFHLAARTRKKSPRKSVYIRQHRDDWGGGRTGRGSTEGWHFYVWALPSVALSLWEDIKGLMVRPQAELSLPTWIDRCDWSLLIERSLSLLCACLLRLLKKACPNWGIRVERVNKEGKKEVFRSFIRYLSGTGKRCKLYCGTLIQRTWLWESIGGLSTILLWQVRWCRLFDITILYRNTER